MKLMPIKLSGLLGAVLAVSLATGSAGQAQTGTDSQCKSPEYTAAKVEQIKRIVEGIRDAVELVPPEERNYIRAETKIAMDQQNESVQHSCEETVLLRFDVSRGSANNP